MKYLPCSLLPYRFHTWDFLELLVQPTYTIWSLMRFGTWRFHRLSVLLCGTLYLIGFNTSFLLWWQFVSPTHVSNIYSEKLVHLPHCYFVNDYKQVGIST